MRVKNVGKKRRLASDKGRQKRLDYKFIVEYITRQEPMKGGKLYIYTNPSLKSNPYVKWFLEDQ